MPNGCGVIGREIGADHRVCTRTSVQVNFAALAMEPRRHMLRYSCWIRHRCRCSRAAAGCNGDTTYLTEIVNLLRDI